MSTNTCTHIYIPHTHMHHTHICRHAYIPHTYIHPCVHTHAQTCIHHTHMHKHMHTHTYTHVYTTHTRQAWAQFDLLLCLHGDWRCWLSLEWMIKPDCELPLDAKGERHFFINCWTSDLKLFWWKSSVVSDLISVNILLWAHVLARITPCPQTNLLVTRMQYQCLLLSYKGNSKCHREQMFSPWGKCKM